MKKASLKISRELCFSDLANFAKKDVVPAIVSLRVRFEKGVQKASKRPDFRNSKMLNLRINLLEFRFNFHEN